MTNNQFLSALKSSAIERQVEDAYNEIFKTFFKGIEISYPFQCDGYFEIKDEDKIHRVIVEYKYDSDYSSKVEMARTACQMLFYLKKFEKNGRPLPNVCVIADKNECFVFHSNVLLKYLDFDGVDWSKAPSAAGFVSPELLVALSEDADFNPFVFRVNEWFNIEDLKTKIMDLATNTHRLVHITEHNIDKIFNAFCERVVIDKKKISPNDLVGLFFGCICDKENYYLHPGKKNTLVSPLGTFRVDSRKFEAFFKYFSNEVSPKEKLRLAAISDRLIEDTNRRRKGEFYTPTPFVDKAHEMISEAFGENWKDEYVVWDCCCGTKNLTRDYKFKELYCSTLEQAELDIAKQYNPEAVSFVFDFLNDPLDKVPEGLQKALKEGKKILFFINPPYACNGAQFGEGKGNSKTEIQKLMKVDELDGINEIFNQFLYRITKIKNQFCLKNCSIALFCKPSFMTKQSYRKFRKLFISNFEFNNAILFNAGHFASVSSKWGISFSIWNSGETEKKNDFIHTLVDLNENYEIVSIGKKDLYNLDGINSLMEWVYGGKQEKRTIDWPTFKGKPEIFFENGKGKVTKDTLSIIYNAINGVGNSNIFYVGNNGGRFPITKSNFDRCCQAYVVKTNLLTGWQYDKDELCAPEKQNVCFANDSIVYTVFGSNTVALRNVEYHNKTWNIPNEFFWMSKSEIEDLANENSLDETYADARTSSDRFVYNKLQEIELSPEAKAVLDKANELVRKSFKYRKIFNEMRPEVQILNWDCGWYQIKQLLKEFMPNELKEFNALFKALADKMRPQIYELGFLKK